MVQESTELKTESPEVSLKDSILAYKQEGFQSTLENLQNKKIAPLEIACSALNQIVGQNLETQTEQGKRNTLKVKVEAAKAIGQLQAAAKYLEDENLVLVCQVRPNKKGGVSWNLLVYNPEQPLEQNEVSISSQKAASLLNFLFQGKTTSNVDLTDWFFFGLNPPEGNERLNKSTCFEFHPQPSSLKFKRRFDQFLVNNNLEDLLETAKRLRLYPKGLVREIFGSEKLDKILADPSRTKDFESGLQEASEEFENFLKKIFGSRRYSTGLSSEIALTAFFWLAKARAFINKDKRNYWNGVWVAAKIWSTEFAMIAGRVKPEGEINIGEGKTFRFKEKVLVFMTNPVNKAQRDEVAQKAAKLLEAIFGLKSSKK